MAPIVEELIRGAAVAAAKHIAEHPSETLEAVGDIVIIKPIEKATSFIEWLSDQIPG